MTDFVIDSKRASLYDEKVLGGKAKNMFWLSANGFNVPEWMVVTTFAFKEQLKNGGLEDLIMGTMNNLPENNSEKAEKLKTLRAEIEKTALSDSISKQLEEKIKSFGDISNEFFAVRSSVVGEDAAGASFAGQMDSFLFVKGVDQIKESVINCFASAFTDRAILYRLEKGLPVTDIEAAVIIQRMVEGEVSGVMFTAHPVTGSRKHSLVTAAYGIGEGIVSGICNTDEFSVDHDSREIEALLSDKDQQVIFDRETGYGTKEVAVEENLRNISCLENEMVNKVSEVGENIASLLQCPQDIEWAVRDKNVYILQTRPITMLPPPKDNFGKKIVWDNSNIQESYCGVTTPLTFSYANMAYSTVYETTMRLLNLPEEQIEDHRDMLDNMLGLLNGRVYYNINNWYRGLLLLPSFKTNKADMERMMGLQDPVDFIESKELSFGEKLRKIPRLIRSLIRLMWKFHKIDDLVYEFKANFDRHYKSVDRSKLHTMQMAELMELTEELKEGLLKNWSSPIVNDFLVMMQNGKVHRWLEGVGYENVAIIQNNLICGEEGIESTEPTKYLLRMCAEIRQKPLLQELFEKVDNERLLSAIQVNDDDFYKSCLEYIELYGDRCIGELKLESISLREDPSFMFACIKNFLKKPDLNSDTLASKELELRHNAEKEVFEKIQKKHGRRKLGKFKKDLIKLRQAIKNRENMRLARTRMFGLFRDIYREIGKQLEFYGFLDHERDIFYITVEELDAYMDGRSSHPDFKSLARSRKLIFEEYKKEDLPHHFHTAGPVYHHNEYKYPGEEAELDASGDLKGIGCYPGIVEKRVKLIFSPEDELSLDGQILCTVRTDPGWAPLFPTAGGIVVERGSTLSHSAVVARELGIPAIVGVPNITKILKYNDLIRMDGAQGTIKVLDEKEGDQDGLESEKRAG